ncbi:MULTISPECIES: hypothetical protein [unclassified Saccharicrinis]|uniref:hypothetical protein n=1 Tax=unclassified Saccharicrinis TaxID=2646859 RepID=UPI003D3432F9
MRRYLNLVVIIISIATILSGLVQMLSPQTVLNIIQGEITEASSHFFAIVGMFMTLFGGLMIHAIYSPYPQKPAILWCALQKLGAFVAVGVGILNGIFAPIAAGVALFDLFSGLLFLYYLKELEN